MRHIAILGFGLLACSGGGNDGGLASNEVAFHAEQDLLPGFSFDTGPQPSSGPVQLELVITSKSSFTADAVGVGVDDGTKSLVGKPASGKLALDGAFAFTGHLKVDVSGLSYDGDVPGLTNASITFAGTSAFDPFLLAQNADVKAPVVGNLPSIPLPGGLPGTLDLTIDPGTELDFSLHGTCAALSGDQATYHAALARSGTIKITPVVTLKVPVVGTKQFPLPPVTIALPSAPAGVDLGTKTITFGSSSVQGEHANATTCDPVSSGDDGGTDGGVPDSSTTDATSDAPTQTFNPVSASCTNSGFQGTLTLTPSTDGVNWDSALLSVTGGAGTHNNASIWVVTDDEVGSYTTTTTTKVLDTTDDYIANDPPRLVTNWTPQRRSVEMNGSHKITRHYYATIIFDKSGTDPSCDTGQLDQTK